LQLIEKEKETKVTWGLLYGCWEIGSALPLLLETIKRCSGGSSAALGDSG
jgi:hypothetical protein